MGVSQEKLLDYLRERHGMNVCYANAKVYMTYLEALEYLGPRCKEYEPLCSCCEGWVEWNRTQTVTVCLDRDDVLGLIECRVDDSKVMED